MTQEIQSIADQFFRLMSVTIDELSVEIEDEERAIYRVTLKTPDSKILIGVHGQTLDLAKHLLSRMLEKRFKRQMLIHLEINDYLKAKDERLFRYIDSRIAEAERSGEPVSLSSLTAYERKKVHSYVTDKNLPGLRAWSEGEKEDRSMKISYEKTPEARIAEITEDGIGI